MPERGPLPWAAIGFALAAALSSWSPLSAPFGLVVGLASLVLGVRALRRPGGRRLGTLAVVLSAVAILGSVLVLALTAGVGRDLAGAEIVPSPPPAETTRDLDAASERTRGSRERARAELDALEGAKGEGGEAGSSGRR